MKKIILYTPLIVMLLLVACSGSDSLKTVTANDGFRYVELPDGSQALLNLKSSIVYDTLFTVREVKQSGEVFYIVEKAENTFVVNTENGKIEVKGTEFNVKAEKNSLEVEVEKGSVELKVDKGIQLISNGQKALFAVDGENIKIGKADFEYKRWTKTLAKEFKKLGKDIEKTTTEVGKEIEKESKQLGREIGDESKKLGKEVGKSFKKLEKELK